MSGMTITTATESANLLRASALTHYSGALAGRLQEAVIRARQEAAEHRPPTDAGRIDKNEAELQSEAEKAMAGEHQIFSYVLTEASREAHDLQQKVPELEARIQRLLADDSAQSEAMAAMAEERAKLVAATELRMRAEVDLRAFRARHGITEQAKYPESRIWHFAIIFVLALVETIVNAFFYENAQGLMGGFFIAASVAVVNMGGAFVLGLLFRFKNLVEREKKIGGWLCLVAFVLLTVYCNALFSSFRANYQTLTDPSDPMQLRHAFRAAAGQAARVFEFGMQFGDLMSFILFGTGLLLSFFAFYKGYTFDDRFPEHGDKDRTVRRVRQAEADAQDAVREKLKTFLQQRRREAQAIAREAPDLMSATQAAAAGVQHAHTVFQAQQDAIQRDFSLVLRAYRDANAAIRATAPPAYFQTISDIRTPFDDRVMAGVLGILSAAHERARALRDRYQEALNTKLNELQRNTAVLLETTYSNFLRSVESDAEEAINRTTVVVHRVGSTVQAGNA